ncbi:unnamed protein product [Trifolium pratense]|uniref:Uncharacterized protein n=1 Tax=Trifolium pratense TaxID=57577 RepID=A0ACB0K6G6_TRIPR|nr:unnamed protein product [Trifolium pratense]
MASGSDIGKTLPYAGKWTTATLSSYDEDVVPEPSLRLDLQKFWESQLIFPYSVDNLVHAFGGPKPSDKSRNSKVLSIFPVYKPCAPRVFISEPYNFSYIKAPNRVFRSAPSLNDQYLGWLDRVQRDKADIWQACGIYDLIQLSRTGLKYQQEMIIAALRFFGSSTNTFHFECGMMTPTLLDVAAITGLSPLGDTYDPWSKSKAGSSNSNKPLPPPPKVELKITSRKRSHSTETPSASKKQRPIPATCSSAPDKDIPVLSTILEQTNTATTQNLPHNVEPITDEKKKKKKKKKEHQSNQEGTPEQKSSEIEAQPNTLASPENPPLEQSEKKKKKKKKHRKSPAAATVVEASAIAKETTPQPEASVTHQAQPQNSAQVIPQDEPAPSKAAEGVIEGPSGTQPEGVLEKSPSPQPVETAILTETSSPPKAPGSPHRVFEDDTLKPNNEEDQLDQGLPQQNPLTNPAQVLTDNDPPTNLQADPAANLSTEQRPTVDGEHSTTNQPQPSGSNHESSSTSADTFDSDDGNSYIGDSLGEEGTSVSKPPPTVVLPAELAKELKDLTPADALNKLLSSHGASSSAVKDTEGKEDALAQEQFEHEIRFRREILNGDMLGLLERDSSIYYNIKALFRKLQNPRTNEAMFLLVTQAETFLEQFVSQSQLLTRTSNLLTSLLATQQHHFEQANNCNAEVTTIKAASDEALEQLVACENNIAQWQSEIEALKEKVRQEEAKMEKLAAVAIEAQKVKLDELAREGIQHYSDCLAVQKRVEHLASDKEMLQRKLVSIRTQYYQFQAANRKPPSPSQQQP